MNMNIEGYRSRLLDLEQELSTQVDRDREHGRDQLSDSAGDVADASVADEEASQSFAEAGRDAAVLAQVREALGRIDAGTFGQCVVDGGPIEPDRLAAVPWAPYCVKHQALLEGSAPKPPTL